MNARLKIQRLAFWLGILGVVWVIASFIYLPIGAALNEAFIESGRFSTNAISDLARSRRVQSALLNTVVITLLSVVTVNVVGIFQVAILEYIRVRGAPVLKMAFATPLVFVSIVAAAGYKFTYGEDGIVTRGLQQLFPSLNSQWFEGWIAVLYAHTFLLTSFHFLFLRAAIRKVDYSTVEAARSLGASNYRAFVKVVLPVLIPTILATSLLVTYKSLGSFAVPVILGGEDFSMISEIILSLNSIRRPDMAALLALLLGFAVVLCILAMQYIEARGSYVGGSKTPVRIRKVAIKNPLVNAMVHLIAYALFLIYALPVLLTLLFSFANTKSIVNDVIPTALTFKNYYYVFSKSAAFTPFANSILMGTVAVAIGLSISLFAAPVIHRYQNWGTKLIDISLFIPWILPYALLAIGLIIAFDEPSLLLLGNVLLGTFWILPLAYGITSIPLMVRFLRATFWSLDPCLGEAARSLGASPLYSFRRITLPLILPVVILVAAMSFNGIISEYTLSAFLYNVNNRPLSIALVDGARDPNPEQTAINLVYISLIMVFSFSIIAIADHYGLGREKSR